MKKKKLSRLSKAEKLEKTLEGEHEKSCEYRNRLMYLQADFENYKKRMEKEIYEVTQVEKERLIVNLLSVMDELELALHSGKETDSMRALLEGVEITLKKIYTTLGQEGLTKIEAFGKPFDPKLHEVVMKVQTKECEEGVVIEEVRTGYRLRNKVIRPSVVKIATEMGVES